MKFKIMDTKDLEAVLDRLSGCVALLDALSVFSESTAVSGCALTGVSDLISETSMRFERAIRCADDYKEEA